MMCSVFFAFLYPDSDECSGSLLHLSLSSPSHLRPGGQSHRDSRLVWDILPIAGLPTCLSELLPECQAVCPYLPSCLFSYSANRAYPDLLSFLWLASLLSAPCHQFLCWQLQLAVWQLSSFIYRPNIMIGSEGWRCREGERRGQMICKRCSVWA